jgi:hypothetical protein
LANSFVLVLCGDLHLVAAGGHRTARALRCRRPTQTVSLRHRGSPLAWREFGAHDSKAFAAIRSTAHDGLNPRLAWWEWCAEWGPDIDDQAVWVRVNPAVAEGRVPLQAIVDDRAILPADQFQAERLSMWPPSAARHIPIIEASAWEELCNSKSRSAPGAAPSAFGVDMSHSLEISVHACWMLDERAHVEEVWAGIDVAAAITWIAVAAGRHTEVVIDDLSPAAQMIPELRARRVKTLRSNGRDMAKGCLLFETRMNSATMSHGGQKSLTDAVMGARKRPIGDAGGWGWDRRDSTVSIHQVVAGTLALLGATSAGENSTGEAFFL